MPVAKATSCLLLQQVVDVTGPICLTRRKTGHLMETLARLFLSDVNKDSRLKANARNKDLKLKDKASLRTKD